MLLSTTLQLLSVFGASFFFPALLYFPPSLVEKRLTTPVNRKEQSEESSRSRAQRAEDAEEARREIARLLAENEMRARHQRESEELAREQEKKQERERKELARKQDARRQRERQELARKQESELEELARGSFSGSSSADAEEGESIENGASDSSISDVIDCSPEDSEGQPLKSLDEYDAIMNATENKEKRRQQRWNQYGRHNDQ